MNYNLLDEHWIPVLYHNGTWKRVGIRTALFEAHKIRQIAASNPMDRVAILRFLLALLYWCKGNPPDNVDALLRSGFPAEWFTKLDDKAERFNLLGNGKRFYQDPVAERRRTATDLIQEIPTGNNFWHFRHSTDEIDSLCPACCAMGLLRLPLFSVSGLPDLKAGINGTPPLYVLPIGCSLMETLRLNWTQNPLLGEPSWIQPDYRPSDTEDVPLLTGLTLLSRRVLLHKPESIGSCIGCGKQEIQLIRLCEFQTAGEQKSNHWNDPHVLYLDKTAGKALKATDLTAAGRFRMDRPWPDLIVNLKDTQVPTSQRSLLVVGFATDKAKNIDVWERQVSLNISSEPTDTSAMTLQWQKENFRLEKSLVRSKTQSMTAMTAIRPHLEQRVSQDLSVLIGSTAETWIAAASEFFPMMKSVAKSLSPGITTFAIEHRQKMTRARPNMYPKEEKGEKSVRRRGIESD